jgi:hypothetical protein
VKRLAILIGLLAAGCAQVQAPPGGPEQFPAPELQQVRPADDAVVPGWRDPVVFAFDQRLSEQNLAEAVTVSPRTSEPVISRRGGEVRVALREGWRPGTIYQVTLHPVLRDLWNNPIEGPHRVVFSTGPEIPETLVEGVVIDRIAGTPEPAARVEAIRMADSLVYAARADSAGAFRLDRIPEGEFLLRAYDDQNRNRALDPFEPRDTAMVTVRANEPRSFTFRLLEPDTTPPVLAAARAVDGIIEAEFDDHLDPEQSLGAVTVRLVDPAGVVLPVARMAVGTLPAPTGEPEAVDLPADAPPAEPDPPLEVAPVEDPEEPLPSQTLVIEPAEPLAPGATYRLEITGVRNLHGLVGGGEAEVVVPEAPEPAEETPPGADADPDVDPPTR